MRKDGDSLKIEIECRGFNPALIKVVTDTKSKIAILKNKIIIESSNEPIRCITIKSRSIYSSRLCYLNIINPIYYLYQYKLKNDDIYFYDDNFIWTDVVLKDIFDADVKIKLSKNTKQANGSTISEYEINTHGCKNGIRIKHYDMPKNQICRYKRTNIASQLFFAILILYLMIFQLIYDRENFRLYLSALIINFVISGFKIYKYHSSKSKKQSK